MPHITVSIRGMHCASCEILIGDEIKKIHGVSNVTVYQKRGLAEVFYHDRKPTEGEIDSAVRAAGYEVGEKEKLPWFSRNSTDYFDLFQAAIILYLLYLLAQKFNLFNLSFDTPNTGVAVALLVGVVAGVSTCMALIGGLVLGLSARHAELHPEASAFQKFRPHLYFNLGRILGFTALGGMIGLIGAAFQPSTNLLGILTMVVGGVMIFFGLKLIEIFPVLHDKSITLPSGIARFFGITKEVKEYSHRGAMVTGALTFFLPCGFTQAMQIYAVSTGSFVQGALIMGLFAVGTSAGLLGIGGLTSVFKGHKARLFYMGAGLTVLFLGWFNLANGSRLLSGSKVSALSPSSASEDAQEIRMTQNGNGYSPKSFTVEKGRPVKWIINSTSSFTCASTLVMPKYGISKSLQPGENIITFTPTALGEIPFSCSMGMYRGKFIVVDSLSPNSLTTSAQEIPLDRSCSTSGGCAGCMRGSLQ